MASRPVHLLRSFGDHTYPACHRAAVPYTDMNTPKWRRTTNDHQVTCKHCLKVMARDVEQALAKTTRDPMSDYLKGVR